MGNCNKGERDETDEMAPGDQAARPSQKATVSSMTIVEKPGQTALNGDDIKSSISSRYESMDSNNENANFFG